MSVSRGLVLTLLCVACNGQWMTEYDQHFKIECPDQQIIKSLESQHDNKYEDRVWNMICALATNEIRIGACEWSGYVNNYDELLEYQCADERIIAGIESIHENAYEDRKYSFKCCVPEGVVAHSCEITPYVNDYDKLFNYRVPDGFAIKGVDSVHDNHYEDRIFKFEICKLDRATIVGK
ncbi:unnamed protein product [Candidula unifasciata]|uniref:Dermatopontin n=1 Tax=Candidula unifasciata TaxID=100452 RepID=A0A8S3ZG24_9EUPU|nr:unnamed protein product [Candidula unifasciata]